MLLSVGIFICILFKWNQQVFFFLNCLNVHTGSCKGRRSTQLPEEYIIYTLYVSMWFVSSYVIWIFVAFHLRCTLHAFTHAIPCFFFPDPDTVSYSYRSHLNTRWKWGPYPVFMGHTCWDVAVCTATKKLWLICFFTRFPPVSKHVLIQLQDPV